jgi:mannose-6-phosphate isomerase
LEWYEAHPGDTFFIPAGTVHAIGAGLVLCEIQQTSDITYRLYDYGRPRELHLDQGVSVSHTGRHAARQRSGQEVLVECPFFTTQRHSISGQRTLTAVGRAHTLIVLEGEGEVGSEGARAGDVFYVSTGTAPVTVRGELTLLRTFS